MPVRLSLSDASFEKQFNAFLTLRAESDADVSAVVKDIITNVKQRGDDAVFDYTKQFDDLELTPNTIRLSKEKINALDNECPTEVREALRLAAKRIRTYHEKQMPSDVLYKDDTGTELGWKWTPIRDVGLYVPGGRASYPSSVLMNAVPAQVAGCARLAMVVPTPKGEINPAIITAANIAGIDEIYTIGGAQAIAALAYGTDSITPVHTIVGPGNAYVAEAKRQVFGKVGIDMIAGPSEILVVADNQNDPAWIAADLLSQAEHDPVAQSILITDDEAFADDVISAIEETLDTLDREEIARESWNQFGAIIVVSSFEDAVFIIDELAPEHLELAIQNPQALSEKIRNAGAIFLGRYTPEAIGDYIAGPSHVLPTSRSARFSSGLSVYDFIKKTSLIGCNADSFQKIGEKAYDLALSEGLDAHALSLKCRIAQK